MKNFDELSRIDKFFLDKNSIDVNISRVRRTQRTVFLNVGDDVRESHGLQLALLTAVNLGAKCFANKVIILASNDVLFAPCLVSVAKSETLGEAILELGGNHLHLDSTQPDGCYLILGNAANNVNALRLTFDGWCIAVGPSNQLPRLAEQSFCPLASIAVAAIAIGELFIEFAELNITATRRIISFSLWRPELPIDNPESVGKELLELPSEIGIFGLGHLGQAYLWGIASLRHCNVSR